jgi:hypothetical protein
MKIMREHGRSRGRGRLIVSGRHLAHEQTSDFPPFSLVMECETTHSSESIDYMPTLGQILEAL